MIWGSFSCENTPKGRTGIHKWVGEMVIMNDLEWPMLSYDVICYEKFWKIMQRTEKEALKILEVLLNMDLIFIQHLFSSVLISEIGIFKNFENALNITYILL